MAFNRREAITILAGSGMAAAAGAAIPLDIVKRHDDSIESFLKRQETDPRHRFAGGFPDADGLYWHGSAAGMMSGFAVAFCFEGSRFHHSPLMLERMRLADDFLRKGQSAQGNIDHPHTNFNSPPDTAFAVAPVASAALVARARKEDQVFAVLRRFLETGGNGLASGGVHTPNHRWVTCASLAQINELFPRPEYVRRINQWLAEGIDIDEDGQYSERSTSVYNPITDRALIVMAHKLKRPELLEPVRRNLNALAYLLHPGGEVVTEISRRQDLYQRARIDSHWFPLQYMAVRDGSGLYAAMANQCAPAMRSLAAVLEYPELLRGVKPAALPDNYEKKFPVTGIARIRRGDTSITLMLGGSSRFIAVRRGSAVVTGIRFASAFFGKGQFVPSRAVREGRRYVFTQELTAPYWQPLEKTETIVEHDAWTGSKQRRRQSEVCEMRHSAVFEELPGGFSLRLQAAGTNGVPVAVEIALDAEGEISGAEPAGSGNWLLSASSATYRAGAHGIRIGPGLAENRYMQVRGAEAPIPGKRVYLTGYTPFDHTLRFEWI